MPNNPFKSPCRLQDLVSVDPDTFSNLLGFRPLRGFLFLSHARARFPVGPRGSWKLNTALPPTFFCSIEANFESCGQTRSIDVTNKVMDAR